jgi:hypothetical protein
VQEFQIGGTNARYCRAGACRRARSTGVCVKYLLMLREIDVAQCPQAFACIAASA